MPRIACFTDNAAVARIVQQSLTDRQHSLHFLTASRLTDDLRQQVRRLAPDVIVLELSQAVDNLHLFFFLRSDQATRHIPVIMLAANSRLVQQATMLGANSSLQLPFLTDQLSSMVANHLRPLNAAVVAA